MKNRATFRLLRRIRSRMRIASAGRPLAAISACRLGRLSLLVPPCLLPMNLRRSISWKKLSASRLSRRGPRGGSRRSGVPVIRRSVRAIQGRGSSYSLMPGHRFVPSPRSSRAIVTRSGQVSPARTRASVLWSTPVVASIERKLEEPMRSPTFSTNLRAISAVGSSSSREGQPVGSPAFGLGRTGRDIPSRLAGNDYAHAAETVSCEASCGSSSRHRRSP